MTESEDDENAEQENKLDLNELEHEVNAEQLQENKLEMTKSEDDENVEKENELELTELKNEA